jgi:hypothetical protein
MNLSSPPPTPYSCPHCGAAFETPQTFCPRCGARLVEPTSGPSFWKILIAIFLGLVALPTGAVGGCLLVMTAFSIPNASAEVVSVSLIGLFFLGVAALCIYEIRKLMNK